MKILDGYKTYLLCIFGIIVLILVHKGLLTEYEGNTILQFLGIGAVASLRAAVGKTQTAIVVESTKTTQMPLGE